MLEADIKDWEYLINVNLYGVVHGIKAFLPLLVEQGGGPHCQYGFDGRIDIRPARRALHHHQICHCGIV